MKYNMGKIDRVLRAVIGLVLLALTLTGQISGTTALVLAIVAVVFLLTSLVGLCPLYMPFKISTKKE